MVKVPLHKQNTDSLARIHIYPPHTLAHTNTLTALPLVGDINWSSSSNQEVKCEAQSRTIFSSSSRNPTQRERPPGNTEHKEAGLWVGKQPHLCVNAIFSLSFSDLRCVSAGLACEAFSSSVPLTLDAWVEDGVSRPDSWPKWIIFTCYCLSLYCQKLGIMRKYVFMSLDKPIHWTRMQCRLINQKVDQGNQSQGPKALNMPQEVHKACNLLMRRPGATAHRFLIQTLCSYFLCSSSAKLECPVSWNTPGHELQLWKGLLYTIRSLRSSKSLRLQKVSETETMYRS